MPAEQPGGVKNIAQGKQVSQMAQARAFLLRRLKLEDRKGNPANIDDSPDGKNIPGWDKKDLEAV